MLFYGSEYKGAIALTYSYTFLAPNNFTGQNKLLPHYDFSDQVSIKHRLISSYMHLHFNLLVSYI